MRFVSPILKHAIYPTLSRTGYLQHYGRAGDLCVLTYHGVRPAGYISVDSVLDGCLISTETFRSQLRFLKARYSVISPRHALEWLQAKVHLPPRAILLTCDDGLENVLTDMVPILEEESLSCLFFVTGASLADEPSMLWFEELYLMLHEASRSKRASNDSGARGASCSFMARRNLWRDLMAQAWGLDSKSRAEFLGKKSVELDLQKDWRQAYRSRLPEFRRFFMLTRTRLRELSSRGMSIGSHSLSHPMLPRTSKDDAWKEISESRGRLEAALGDRVWALVYPFGGPESVTSREMAMAENAGYRCAFLNFGGGFGAELSLFAMPRVHVAADMTRPELEAHISGFHRALQQITSLGRGRLAVAG